MSNSSELYVLLSNLWDDLHDVKVLWQLAVLIAGIGAGQYLQQIYRRRVALLADPAGAHKISVGSIQRLVFPLSALALVLIGRAILRHWQPVSLLNLAVPLLFSFALIRICVYMLRRVFAPSGWLRASERYIAWGVWIGVALYITGLWPEVRQFLDDYAFHVGKQRISLLLIVQGVLSVGVTLFIALWLGRFLETRLMGATSLDINLRVMFSKLAQALLVLLAVLIVLPAVGLDLTLLSVFGGMLGVGIGFGLQKIASNYVSGFIILMDRSVSIGDLITVDQHTGQLTKMTARYVVVRSLTGVEAIIPNETIITSTVTNHSYTDRRVRVPVSVQVSYQSDLDAAIRIMEQAAQQHARVLRDPAPKVLVKEFADNGINLELGVWIEDPQEGTGNLRSDLNYEIWREFKTHSIEIPYPQREVRILGSGATPIGAP